ncbi:GIY-YIG nuclease family protein [Epilithonimonas arachidiradicis]|uniref:GIY-YIG catalytic domain-containing protein n=1 Tax=Epilithonimonas arachidiradicis TaxID=1617282 RepID=A0A420CMF0_9FLAO|nr:hypothetical protein [Epilithonimonas arachidiradicis]RKE79563.1 hypothetical protein BXY58_3215 [Epilithonimonas arachidiradicis]GGG66216.1 hypothetical protein GCM10007332_31070 [Epilithonimonas arachidiradicis]
MMNFSEEIIERLRGLVITYEKSDSAEDRKKARRKMQKLDFRMTDFNIRNITSSDFNKLISSGKIKILSNIPTSKINSTTKQKFQEVSTSVFNLLAVEYSTINRDFINELNFYGLYSLRLKEKCLLPKPFQQFLSEREHQIIYVGKAQGQTLKERLNQELFAKGHGTFFRSIGAVLGYLPEAGSLHGKSNQNNYKFIKEDQKKIIFWIENNLEIAVFKTSNFEEEKHLICKLKPLLNDSHNPLALAELRMAKDKCRITARNT